MHLIRGDLYELDVEGTPIPVKLLSVWKKTKRRKDCTISILAHNKDLPLWNRGKVHNAGMTLRISNLSSKNLKKISKKDLPLYIGLKNHTPEFLDMLKNTTL